VFSGGIIEGNIGWEIKSSDSNALVMYDSPLLSQNNRAYMALYVAESSSETPVDISAPIKNNELLQELQDLIEEGSNLSDQSKYDEAIEALDKAIELCPKIRDERTPRYQILFVHSPGYSKGRPSIKWVNTMNP
jgi:hypothetical protein